MEMIVQGCGLSPIPCSVAQRHDGRWVCTAHTDREIELPDHWVAQVRANWQALKDNMHAAGRKRARIMGLLAKTMHAMHPEMQLVTWECICKRLVGRWKRRGDRALAKPLRQISLDVNAQSSSVKP